MYNLQKNVLLILIINCPQIIFTLFYIFIQAATDHLRQIIFYDTMASNFQRNKTDNKILPDVYDGINLLARNYPEINMLYEKLLTCVFKK